MSLMSSGARARRWVLLGLSALLLTSPSLAALSESARLSDVSDTDKGRCVALENEDLSDLQDAPTQLVDARVAPAVRDDPAQCLVSGYVVPQVGFELRLPSSGWNGKLMVVGNAGWGGGLSAASCARHVKRGYACVTTNAGHSGAGTDGLWASNDLPAQVDFAYRSIHVVTLAAKEITRRYYSREPQRSYFVGCSTGGYQGLIEAQRFPWDFDGIIAGAPDMDEARLTMRELWSTRVFLDAQGKAILDDESLNILHQAVLAQCDRDDGLADGIISNPLSCRFDPSTLACKPGKSTQCLTRSQIDAVRRIYDGPPEPREASGIRGVLPGSELAWSNPVDGLGGTVETSLANGFFRYMVYGATPQWTAANYDFARDDKRLGLAALYSDTNPDLRRLKAAGTKLLVYQGWNDIIERPTAIVDYYETVEKVMGGQEATQSFFRLFMIPGMSHCGGGVGAANVNYIRYLEDWVEKRELPEHLLGHHISDNYLASLPPGSVFNVTFDDNSGVTAPVTFTRPIYPYPKYARYTGVGDPSDAANFVSYEPVTTLKDH